MRERHDRRQKGFTLIEIVIVVVIVIAAALYWLWPRGQPPAVSGVEILQPEVFAAPGSSFRWQARVLGSGDRVLDATVDPDLKIEWSSATPQLFRRIDGNDVVVDVPLTTGLDITDVVATATWRGTTLGSSGSATLHVGPDVNSGSTTDWVHLSYEPDQPPSRVVIDAMEQGSAGCSADDLVVWAVGRAPLERDFVTGAACSDELGAFTPGFEMAFGDGKGSQSWSVGRNDWMLDAPRVYGWDTDPSTVPNSFRKVLVVVGMPANTAADFTMAKEQLRTADDMMRKNGLGIGLRLAPTGGEIVHGFVDDLEPWLACDPSFMQQLLDPLGRSVASEQVLFVMFVKDLYEIATDSRSLGIACLPQSTHHGRILYVALDQTQASTVAHEFGHVLGLMPPFFNWGHADGVGVFERDNILWSTRQLSTAARRTRLSLGQLFRMNLDVASWITMTALASTRTCQITVVTGTCPAIDLGEPGATP